MSKDSYAIPLGRSEPYNPDLEDRKERQEAASATQPVKECPLPEKAAQEAHDQIERALELLCNALIDCASEAVAKEILHAIGGTRYALFAAAKDLHNGK